MSSSVGITNETKIILFDHDGTLIDSESVHFTLWQKVMRGHNITLTREFFSNVMVGIPVDQNARDIVAHFDLLQKPQALAAQKHQLTREYLAEQAFPLIDNARETIVRCFDAGYRLGIVTGGSRLAVEQTLDTYDLRDFFDVTISVEDVAKSKPDPQSYEKALNLTGFQAREAVAVEDTMHGMRSAVAAGIACVVIPTSQSSEHDFDAAVARYGSLNQWLDRELT